VSVTAFLIASTVYAQQQFQVMATVVDVSGVPVAGLQPADVEVLEDGKPGRVTKIEPVERPVRLQLLLDTGVGLGGEHVNHLRTGVRGLLEALPEGVEVTIVTTAPQPRFLVRATTDRQAQLKGLDLLASDSGAGSFVDSLIEAAERISKDKRDSAHVIVAAGTASGDQTFIDRDVHRMLDRLRDALATVHVLLYLSNRSSSGGVNQTNLGITLTEGTRGRYEYFNTASRLEVLLPEIGAGIAERHNSRTRQFRITVERPGGASGDLGKLGIRTRGGLSVPEVVLINTSR
jgi:hypothetical protein